MPHRSARVIAFAFGVLSHSVPLHAARAQDSTRAGTDSLSIAQLARFERGEPVQVLEAVGDLPWPSSRVYQFVDATPEQGAAVLTDYERQPSYQPTVKRARLVERPSANEAVVHFVIDVPVLPDEAYDMWHSVTCEDGEYIVRWRALGGEAGARARVAGSARFRPWRNETTGRAGTMLVYEQLVIPGSSLARLGFVRERGIQASRDAARNLARQIERERRSGDGLLDAQLRRLRSMLGADFTTAGGSPCHRS